MLWKQRKPVLKCRQCVWRLLCFLLDCRGACASFFLLFIFLGWWWSRVWGIAGVSGGVGADVWDEAVGEGGGCCGGGWEVGDCECCRGEWWQWWWLRRRKLTREEGREMKCWHPWCTRCTRFKHRFLRHALSPNRTVPSGVLFDIRSACGFLQDTQRHCISHTCHLCSLGCSVEGGGQGGQESEELRHAIPHVQYESSLPSCSSKTQPHPTLP